MAASKKTEILGTKGLSSCDSIRVYNQASFKKSNIVDGLGMGKGEVDLLLSEPSSDNILEINEVLSKYSEFEVVKGESGHFTFDNDKLNVINGEGFNVIIFLSYSEVLGFMWLVNPVGTSQDYSTRQSYDLKRIYKLRFVEIELTSEGRELKVDQHTIQLRNDLKLNASVIGRDLSGNKNYNFTQVKDLTDKVGKLSNYTIHVGTALSSPRAMNIFTDQTITRIYKGNVQMSKLDFRRNLVLDNAFESFQNHQIGYYHGDPALFIWDDEGHYSIFSLTITLGELFNEENDRAYAYTVNDSVSLSEIFQVPILDERQGRPKIKHFAGKYVTVESGGLRYLLDIDRQDGELDGQSLGEANKGWLKYKDDVSGEYRLQSQFVVDQSCPVSKVWKGPWSWQNWDDVVGDIPFLTNTWVDSSAAVISNGKEVAGKSGEWVILEGPDSKTYSSFEKSLSMALEENDPIIVNDQTLITWKTGVDEEGRTTETYTLYNSPGYYRTQTFYDRFTLDSDLETRGEPFRESTQTITLRTSSSYTSPASSPLELARSFLGNYRRNVLPETLEGFKIIGAFHGLVFYRIGNTINYL